MYFSRKCKGLFYKYRKNMFINKKKEFVVSDRFIPLKKRSCQGCVECGAIMDLLSDDITLETISYNKNMSNDTIVELIAIFYDDDYELRFYEVNLEELEENQ